MRDTFMFLITQPPLLRVVDINLHADFYFFIFLFFRRWFPVQLTDPRCRLVDGGLSA